MPSKENLYGFKVEPIKKNSFSFRNGASKGVLQPERVLESKGGVARVNIFLIPIIGG